MRLSRLVPHLPFLIPLWLVSLSVYLYTKAPSILYIDAGAIVAAAYEPGIPNPPGFPFYIMVAHLFTKLPFGSVLFRVQLLSLVSSLGVLTLVYFLLQRFFINDFPFVTQGKNDSLFTRSFLRLKANALPVHVARTVALSASFLLAFSYQFWSQTLNSESYIFTNFMLAALLTIALTTPLTPKNLNVRLVAASILLGVASGANPTIVQVVPALLVGVIYFWRLIGWKKLVAMGVIAFFFSVLVYAYLPLRARGYPFLNWGNPQTVALFFGHLRGEGLNIYDPRTNSINGFTGSPEVFAQSFGRYVYLFFQQFTPLLVPLIFLGIYYLVKKNPRLALFLISVPLTNLVFGVLYLSGNQESWFIASYVIFALFMGVGLSVVTKVVLSSARGPVFADASAGKPAAPLTPRFVFLILLLLLLLSVIPFAWWFPKLNRHDFIATREYADNLYANILPNAVLIGSGDFFNQLTHYEYGVVKRRRDVFPVVANMWYILPWYRENLRKHRPDLMPIELETMIKKDRIEEYNEVMNWWIRRLVDRGVAVYVTPMVFRETVLAGTNAGKYVVDKSMLKAVNNGLVYRMLTQKDLLQPNEGHFNYLFKDRNFYQKPPLYLERNYNAAFALMLREYGSSFLGMADYFMNASNREKELSYLRRAYEIAPFSAEIVNRLGIYAISQGDLNSAVRYFKEASEVDPKSFEVKLNFARSLLSTGNVIEARRQLEAIVNGAQDKNLKFEAQKELAKMKLRELSENIPKEWKTLTVKAQRFLLRYPDGWEAKTVGGITSLAAPSDSFTIQLFAGILPKGIERKQWVKEKSPLRFPGVLEREGAAQIPGFDATAAFWNESSSKYGLVRVLEFVLVQDERILHMKVGPADSEMMKQLDSILSTITFTD